jgi:hypothetical protein
MSLYSLQQLHIPKDPLVFSRVPNRDNRSTVSRSGQYVALHVTWSPLARSLLESSDLLPLLFCLLHWHNMCFNSDSNLGTSHIYRVTSRFSIFLTLASRCTVCCKLGHRYCKELPGNLTQHHENWAIVLTVRNNFINQILKKMWKILQCAIIIV